MKIVKTLLEAMLSFVIGAGIIFFVIVCQSLRYMMKNGTAFAFMISGKGAEAGNWTGVGGQELIFMCVAGGIILLIIDLIFNVVKLLMNR